LNVETHLNQQRNTSCQILDSDDEKSIPQKRKSVTSTPYSDDSDEDDRESKQAAQPKTGKRARHGNSPTVTANRSKPTPRQQITVTSIGDSEDEVDSEEGDDDSESSGETKTEANQSSNQVSSLQRVWALILT